MKVKITGQFTNGQPYYAVIPKENLTDVEAQTLLDSESWKDNSSTSDGSPLDVTTLQAELFDGYNYQTLKKACLYQSLFEINELDSLLNKVDEIAAASPQGKVFKIWLDSMQTITRFHSKAIALQTAMGWSDAFVEAFWIRAEEIQSQDI